MSIHTHRTGWVYTTALSWRGIAHRFSFSFFLLFSLGLLFFGYAQPMVVEKYRVRIVDGVAPVMDALSRPLDMASRVTERGQSYRTLVGENQRLQEENQKLLRWQNTALALHNENQELRKLLKYKPEPSLAYISARVIADAGGAYVRSLVVTAGRLDGVREGMAAITGDGLIGRVVEVGEWTSRILLITDINSRIPVMIVGSGDQAILTGDNESQPKLLYLPQDSDVKEGARVLTSGHGGIFPPNLPVGIVSSVSRGVIEVVPVAKLGQVRHVRLVDFNLEAGVVNPMAEEIRAAKPLY